MELQNKKGFKKGGIAMKNLKPCSLFTLMIIFDIKGLKWPLSSSYVSMVAGKDEWQTTLETLEMILREIKVPMSKFFKVIASGDDLMQTMEINDPDFADVRYSRREVLDTMVDVWRNKTGSYNCRAELRKRMGIDSTAVTTKFTSKSTTICTSTLIQMCQALNLELWEVLDSYEKDYRIVHSVQ